MEQQMEQQAHAINWFEIPVLDFARAKTFYSKIFEYEMPEHAMGPYMMGFFTCVPGGVGGAIIHGDGYVPSQTGSIVYLAAGDDLSVVLNRVEAAGGQIVIPKTEIPSHGFFATFNDTEGNRVALHSRD